MRFIRSIATATVLPVLLVAAWWFTSLGSDDFFWPPLRDILTEVPSTWFEGRLGADVAPSLLRLSAGYSLALAIGISAGLAIGLSAPLRQYCEPVFEFLRSIPPPVLVPIIMLFAGIGDSMKIVVIAFGCVWPILLNSVEGARSIDEVLHDTARVYGLGPAARFRHLLLRGASPHIVTGARQALSIAIILVVISEMFAASNGLGFTIVQFQRSFAIPQMWSGILLLGAIGVILALVFKLVENRVLAWYFGLRRKQ
ncbi:ABC-type nitrate/sulfonate/bicarbonate transport system, permease component [Sinosporangium album]|uniref:ABC-type nitrate/sulfonate/bicarbonate transport system, permease component n=1 Tax=Sinosporangium album TaxID=504805 RepID=A0A1G7ZP21_9ACTN|nr:ABC transporter permease [Sinosporangium album]SDH10375.1 ABC-type nitrate/sulfonate/bicarbonate transport system, permease component [Sinosporangium album]